MQLTGENVGARVFKQPGVLHSGDVDNNIRSRIAPNTVHRPPRTGCAGLGVHRHFGGHNIGGDGTVVVGIKTTHLLIDFDAVDTQGKDDYCGNERPKGFEGNIAFNRLTVTLVTLGFAEDHHKDDDRTFNNDEQRRADANHDTEKIIY